MDKLIKIKGLMIVSWKLVQRKTKIYAEEKAASKGQINVFCASEGWLQKFMLRTLAQKNLEQIIDKKKFYILFICRLKQRNNYEFDCIIAMDGTAVIAQKDLQ